MAFANPGARAYQTQSILTASPGQLVLLMYDGALRFMAQARAGFALPDDNPTHRYRQRTRTAIHTQSTTCFHSSHKKRACKAMHT